MDCGSTSRRSSAGAKSSLRWTLRPRAEAQKLVALVSEDLEYFRRHAMAPSHRDKKTPEPDADPATPGEEPTEA